MRKNIILGTDSYKLAHWQQYQPDTEVVYSYFEARKGAEFDGTVFFGLQYLLKEYLEGIVVNGQKIDEAELLVEQHLGDKKLFNRKMWEHIWFAHDGKLPIRIKAVPEGSVVPVGNVMMTVENTCPHCAPLTNHLETLLCHVWHACTVATLSREVKKMVKVFFEKTGAGLEALDFMLHDFGYRGVSSTEAAAIGGLAHLVNFKGTDTVAALVAAQEYYGQKGAAAFSVPATEHSVMTSLGPDGEEKIIGQLLDAYPIGILSVVSDSYDIYNTVENIIGGTYRDRILERDGVFVVRPDSGDPVETVLRLLNILWEKFGGFYNDKGYKVINPKVKVLWGDGLDKDTIYKILASITGMAGWSVENIATFGMGGGLLQKINRDTQRFAFKCSAQKRDGEWFDIYKDPIDGTKSSKRGRLELIKNIEGYVTVQEGLGGQYENQLVTVFEDGEIKKEWNLEEIRVRAQL